MLLLILCCMILTCDIFEGEAWIRHVYESMLYRVANYSYVYSYYTQLLVLMQISCCHVKVNKFYVLYHTVRIVQLACLQLAILATYTRYTVASVELFIRLIVTYIATIYLHVPVRNSYQLLWVHVNKSTVYIYVV